MADRRQVLKPLSGRLLPMNTRAGSLATTMDSSLGRLSRLVARRSVREARPYTVRGALSIPISHVRVG